MVMVQGQFRLLHQHAVHEQTGEIIVPSASGIVGVGERFYNAATDKGHLLCSGCNSAHLFLRSPQVTASARKVRDHFATARGETHPLDCDVAQLGLSYPLPVATGNAPTKAPYFYWNTENIDGPYPHGDKLKKRAWLPYEQVRLPEWIIPVAYGIGQHGFKEIISPEFRHRPRLDPARSTDDMLKILTTLSMEQKEDTWVIVNDVAMRLNELVLLEREGPDVPPRDLSLIPSIKAYANDLYQARYGTDRKLWPDCLMMAENPKYDFFARQAFNMSLGIQFPVLLHATVRTPPKIKHTGNGWKMFIDLGKYTTENVMQSSLSLPTRVIERTVHITDEALFDRLKEPGTEFFATAHPVLERDKRADWRYYQYFRALDVSLTNLETVKQQMAKVYDARERHRIRQMEKAAATEPQPEAIPA